VALAGSELLDVRRLDGDTIALARADGRGRFVLPMVGPPGQPARVADVTSSFDSTDCGCPLERSDGIPDLNLRFSSEEIVDAFGLLAPDEGNQVQVRMMGRLVDGQRFEGVDCLNLVGQAPVLPRPSSPTALREDSQQLPLTVQPNAGVGRTGDKH
jgi:hypothetical protein